MTSSVRPRATSSADARVAIVGERLHLRAFRARQILLIKHNLVSRGCAQRQAFLVGVQRLLLKIARFHSGGVSGARLLQADHSVLHVDANLVDILLQAELALPQLQFAGGVVGLRGAIAQRNIQGDAPPNSWGNCGGTSRPAGCHIRPLNNRRPALLRRVE